MLTPGHRILEVGLVPGGPPAGSSQLPAPFSQPACGAAGDTAASEWPLWWFGLRHQTTWGLQKAMDPVPGAGSLWRNAVLCGEGNEGQFNTDLSSAGCALWHPSFLCWG